MHTRTLQLVILAAALTLYCLVPGSAHAKWWIFGQSNTEVGFSYLFLNKISYEESGPRVAIPASSLPGGRMSVSGKVSVGAGRAGGVRISTDNRETWQEAKLADDGTFEFAFAPQAGTAYVLFVEATDTAGKVNDVERTRKEVTVVQSDVQNLVRSALDELVAAYRGEEPVRFMKMVSPDFTGDAVNLDRAVVKDFSAFDNIDLRFTLNNVTLDPRGRVFAALTFNRSVTSAKGGRTFTDSGATEFIFTVEAGAARVFSMKHPLIFGLSDASEVAQGIAGGNSQPLIIVDQRGGVAAVPPDTFAKLVADGSYIITANTDGTTTIKADSGTYTVLANGTVVNENLFSATVESGPVTLVSAMHPPTGFDFATGTTLAGGGDFLVTGANDGISGYGFLGAGVFFQNLGATPLASVTEVPTTGYTDSPGMGITLTVGHTYAFRLASGKYGLLYIRSASQVFGPTGETITIRFDYKYQTSGGVKFLP
jgi:hypothetical protein